MFGKILYIGESEAHVENLIKDASSADLMNVNVIFEDSKGTILGEVEELNENIIKIRFLGEYVNGKYVNGVLRKPLLNSKIRMINKEELTELVGTYSASSFILGESAIYKGFNIHPGINSLFSNHLAIFGNSGSGKSCGVTRIVQNLFSSMFQVQYNANIFIFDAFGEYKNAFGKLNEINNNYSYKFITSNPVDIKYIGEMLPNISQDILDKQKILQPGMCVCFGSAFKIPMIVKLEMPNPMPYSSNCDVSGCWKMEDGNNVTFGNRSIRSEEKKDDDFKLETGDLNMQDAEYFA